MHPVPEHAVSALAQDPPPGVYRLAGIPGVVSPGGEPGGDPLLVAQGGQGALAAGEAVPDELHRQVILRQGEQLSLETQGMNFDGSGGMHWVSFRRETVRVLSASMPMMRG